MAATCVVALQCALKSAVTEEETTFLSVSILLVDDDAQHSSKKKAVFDTFLQSELGEEGGRTVDRKIST